MASIRTYCAAFMYAYECADCILAALHLQRMRLLLVFGLVNPQLRTWYINNDMDVHICMVWSVERGHQCARSPPVIVMQVPCFHTHIPACRNSLQNTDAVHKSFQAFQFGRLVHPTLSASWVLLHAIYSDPMTACLAVFDRRDKTTEPRPPVCANPG